MLPTFLVKTNKKATADIQEQRGKWLEKGTNITGTMQDNGNFIFYIDEMKYRILVLSTNTGILIKAGRLDLKNGNLEKDWMDPEKWEKADGYRITNFDVGGEKRPNCVQIFCQISIV